MPQSANQTGASLFTRQGSKEQIGNGTTQSPQYGTDQLYCGSFFLRHAACVNSGRNSVLM